MKRKVTLHGPATLSVSLPLKWARKNNIKKGDDVEVVIDRDMLHIGASDVKAEKREIDVSVPKMDGRPLLFLIRHLYVNGYDTIRLRFEKGTIKHYRKKVEMSPQAFVGYEIKRLMGLEITSMKKNTCVLTCMAKESTEELEKSLQRTFFIIKDMFEEMVHAMEEGADDLYQFANDMHDQATTFIAYNLRTLNKLGYNDRITTIKTSEFIYLLDTIVDLTKYLLRELSEYVPYKNKEILAVAGEVVDIFDKSHKLYHTFTLESMDDISRQINSIRDITLDIKRNWNKRESRFLHHIESILEEMFKLNTIRMGMEY